MSSWLAEYMLRALSIPVYRQGNIIDLGLARLQVVDACSGLRYLIPTVFLALLAGRLFLSTFRSRLALLIISPLAALLSNSLRITLTGLLVRYVDPALADGFFHDFSGWLFYVFMLMIMALSVLALKRLEKPEQADTSGPETISAPADRDRKVSPVTLPARGLILALIFLFSFALQHSLVQGGRVPLSRDFSSFPQNISGWQGQLYELSPQIKKSLWADNFLAGTFDNPGTGNSLHLLISYYESQTTRKTAHAPTSCLVGSGWILKSKYELQPDRVRPFPVRAMVMEQGEERILANFWFQQRGRIIASEYMNKLYLLLDSLFMRRTDGALIRVEMHLKPGQTEDRAQELLNEFLSGLAGILKQHIPDDRPEQE